MPVPSNEAAPPTIANHSAHPGHKLKRVADNEGELFICGGCKEPGTGVRYRCDDRDQKSCNDFALHTCCAIAPDRLTHPAFGDRVFLFLQEPPEPPRAGTGARSCAVCGEDVCGFVYYCFDDDIDIHPCCALLPEDAIILDDGGRIFALGKEAPGAARGRETSGDNNRSLKVHAHQPPVARHRRWDGGQAGKRDHPPAGNTQPTNNRVLEVRRQEVSRPGDAPGDRNRGPERAPAVARHRWWTWNWKR